MSPNKNQRLVATAKHLLSLKQKTELTYIKYAREGGNFTIPNCITGTMEPAAAEGSLLKFLLIQRKHQTLVS